MRDNAHIVRDGIEPHPCTAEHFGVDDCQTCRNALAALDALVAERDEARLENSRLIVHTVAPAMRDLAARAEAAEALLAISAADTTAADLAQQIEFYKAGWINVPCEFGCGYDVDKSYVVPGFTIVPTCRIHGPLAYLLQPPTKDNA